MRMGLFKYKTTVEIWVISSNEDTAKEALNSTENPLEFAACYRFGDMKSEPDRGMKD
jgi:hypothetical protein